MAIYIHMYIRRDGKSNNQIKQYGCYHLTTTQHKRLTQKQNESVSKYHIHSLVVTEKNFYFHLLYVLQILTDLQILDQQKKLALEREL